MSMNERLDVLLLRRREDVCSDCIGGARCSSWPGATASGAPPGPSPTEGSAEVEAVTPASGD